jgi:response regulator RpfG family c-di-GMP phosphodiesterase
MMYAPAHQQKLFDNEEKARKKLEKQPLEPEVTQLIAAEQVAEDVAAEVQNAIPVLVAAEVKDVIPAAGLRRRRPSCGQLIAAEQLTEEVASEIQDAIPEAQAGPKVKHE